MAAEVAQRPQDRPAKTRKPFAAWVKRITSLKGNDDSDGSKKKRGAKHKKSNTVPQNNNPYPQSGPLRQRDSSPTSTNGHLSFSTPTSRPQDDAQSYDSAPLDDRDGQSRSNKSGAPTLATKTGTINSDGHSRAATSTTRGGALSSTDGAGAGSTFSSPAPSERSLTTTLTTIQSQSTGQVLQNAHNTTSAGHHSAHHHGSLNNPNPVMFSHQYPTSPAPASSLTASAIPRHIASEAGTNTYSSATANNLLSDDASILTLASSSKRRRRSMDTDASVRALPPSSAWGGSRESLPLSVLSGNLDSGAAGPSGIYGASQSRPSIGGLASAERASIYSAQGVSAPVLASERNSFYSHKPGAKDYSDGKSLRSITNLDARSMTYRDRDADARSINNMDARSQYGDARSLGGVGGVGAGGEGASLKNYESSVRSGRLGHARNDSIPGSIGSPLASPGLSRHAERDGERSETQLQQDGDREREVDGQRDAAMNGEGR